MNEKQLAERLREIKDAPTLTMQRRDELKWIADKLDPPKPEPGDPVWVLPKDGTGWRFGVSVWDDSVPGAAPMLVVVTKGCGYTLSQLETWKPAHILGPRQVAVDVDPPGGWEDDVTTYRIIAAEENQGYVVRNWSLHRFTREEAEHKEPNDEH